MIRYSKTKVVILIILVLVLWVGVRCGISLPLSARSGAHVTIDGDDLTIHSRGCDLVVGPSSDDLVHVEGDGQERAIGQGDVRMYTDDVVTVLVPASVTGLFLDGTESIEIASIAVDSLELATVDGKLSLSGCSARQTAANTIDGDVCITGSSFTRLSIHAIDGDIDIAQCDVEDLDGTETAILLTCSYAGQSGVGDAVMDSLVAPLEAAAPSATTPYIKDITIENLKARNVKYGVVLSGLPEAKLEQLTLKHLEVDSQYGLAARYVQGAFCDCKISAKLGAPLRFGPECAIAQD